MITQRDSAEKKMGKDGLDLKELREAAIYYFVTNTAIVRDEGRLLSRYVLRFYMSLSTLQVMAQLISIASIIAVH